MPAPLVIRRPGPNRTHTSGLSRAATIFRCRCENGKPHPVDFLTGCRRRAYATKIEHGLHRVGTALQCPPMASSAPNSDCVYVTTPIYYVNDRPHIGHVYTTTVCDVFARYHRFAGRDVFFLTGTDEHAAKVVDAAAERGLTPQQWADQNAGEFRETFKRLRLSNDDFIRTSEARHIERVRQYVQALLDTGDVYLGDYEGWYDAGQEEYIPESKAKQLEYKSPFNGKPLVRKAEKNYFFKLSAWREELLTLLEKGEAIDGCTFDVQPGARRNEIVQRIKNAFDKPDLIRLRVERPCAAQDDNLDLVGRMTESVIGQQAGVCL